MTSEKNLKTALISAISDMTLDERRQLLSMWRDKTNGNLFAPVKTKTTQS